MYRLLYFYHLAMEWHLKHLYFLLVQMFMPVLHSMYLPKYWNLVNSGAELLEVDLSTECVSLCESSSMLLQVDISTEWYFTTLCESWNSSRLISRHYGDSCESWSMLLHVDLETEWRLVVWVVETMWKPCWFLGHDQRFRWLAVDFVGDSYTTWKLFYWFTLFISTDPSGWSLLS